jgi:CBS domain-containing protein
MQVVGDFMTRNVCTVETTASIRQAAQLMAENNVGFLPVLHESVTAGVVTDRDIVVRAMAKDLDPDKTCVGAILSTESKPREGAADDITPGAATLLEDTPIDSAIRFMDERGIRRAAVHDHDYRLVGVISRADLPVRSGA